MMTLANFAAAYSRHSAPRQADLKPGALYYSRTGRLCMLQEPSTHGIARTSFCFAYITRNRRSSEEGFAIDTGNATAIAAMRPAPIGGPLAVPRYIRLRGMA